jgi:hypothetical protein
MGSFTYSPFEGEGALYSLYFIGDNEVDAEFTISYSDVVFYSANFSYDDLDVSSGASSSLVSDSTLSLYAEDAGGAGAFMIEAEGLNEGSNSFSALSYAEITLLTPNGGTYGWSKDNSDENVIELYTAGFEEIEGYFTIHLTASEEGTE